MTGGTKVVSDWLKIRAAVRPGGSFLDPMIVMVEGVKRQNTPSETALTISWSARPSCSSGRRRTNMEEGDLWKLIASYVEDRTFSILGDPRVNVLKLNLALDALPKDAAPAR